MDQAGNLNVTEALGGCAATLYHERAGYAQIGGELYPAAQCKAKGWYDGQANCHGYDNDNTKSLGSSDEVRHLIIFRRKEVQGRGGIRSGGIVVIRGLTSAVMDNRSLDKTHRLPRFQKSHDSHH
ncbi:MULTISPECIES: hypothetical protein [Mesorhizobium]|jgi:hypothetical protein|uniref:Uncharacterized protein n=1 Tax=Rhizobium loti TaxID=381 RepID=A0A6M7TVE5_RHILI|nr:MULTISPECIES: hypothetical protein [Mesorhizobium]KRB21212.1 hypothetical protein ASE05_21460 [Mesorhizobium sp. Root172]OBQ65911.1 hypothetical protein A8145_17450 [Mesorhizobium loti]QKC69044.1 hypothetical protein EB815_07785 [Mesorhizobium loti]QKC88350.1 hypothetical protein EB230_07770 [Mesorhizobium sp. NZP2234]